LREVSNLAARILWERHQRQIVVRHESGDFGGACPIPIQQDFQPISGQPRLHLHLI
jgi:hypothetical protein